CVDEPEPPEDDTDPPTPADDCCNQLSEINPWQHEIHIFRNGELVWCGPIVDMSFDNAQGLATIEAKDLFAWMDRRFIRCTIDMTEADLSMIFAAIFRS